MPKQIQISRVQYKKIVALLDITAMNLSTLQIQLITEDIDIGTVPPLELISIARQNLAESTIELMREAV